MENPPSATPPPVSPQPSSGLSERQWAVILHLSAFLGIPLTAFGNIIGPLVIWLIKKPESAYLDRVGKEVLNFQISFSIYFFIGFVLCWIVIGMLILPVISILWLVFTIIGAIKVSNGEDYKFPMTIRML